MHIKTLLCRGLLLRGPWVYRRFPGSAPGSAGSVERRPQTALEFQYGRVPRVRVSPRRKRSAEMASAQEPAVDDLAANRHSHFDCWRSRERRRASSPSGLQYVSDLLFESTAMATVCPGPEPVRCDESPSPELRLEAAGDSFQLPHQPGRNERVISEEIYR